MNQDIMKKEQLISEIASLPVDERISIIDELLQTLNPPDRQVEKAWIAETERRLDEIENGEVEPIPGPEAMEELKKIAEE